MNVLNRSLLRLRQMVGGVKVERRERIRVIF
jgi:hypothetical protein